MQTKNTAKLPLFILSAVLIALLVFLSWPKTSQVKSRGARTVAVKITPVIKAEFIDEVEALGTAKAKEDVIITAQYSDVVESINFEDGDKVKKGDILVELVKAEELAVVKELEANLAESTAKLNRFKELLKKNVASVSERDDQIAKTDAVKAKLNRAEAILSNLTIRAPFDGQLGFRHVSVGASVRNGDVITSLDDLDTIKVDFAIPERFLPTLKIGQNINATSIAYSNEKFVGKITGIESRVDVATRTIKIRAEIPNSELKLRPGMLMAISIVRNIEQVMQLPESAVIPFEDRHFIFTIEDNVAKRKYISIGRRKPGLVEILSGVDLGEQVVIEGALKLREGASVKTEQNLAGSN